METYFLLKKYGLRKTTALLACVLYLFCLQPAQAHIDKKVVPIVSLPFDLVQNQIIIHVRLNHSKPLDFVLDSGTRGLFVYRDIAKKWLENVKEIPAYKTDKDSLLTGKSLGDTLHLKGLHIPAGRVHVYKRNGYGNYAGFKIAGVIGTVLFKDFIVEINYDQQQVHIYDQHDYTYQDDGWAVKLQIIGGLPVVKANTTQINGDTFKTNLVVSTGFMESLVLNKKFTEKNRLFESNLDYYYYYASVLPGYFNPVRKVKINELAILGYFLKDGTMDLLRRDKTMEIKHLIFSANGLIGNEVLKRFNMVFDFSRNVVYVHKNKFFDSEYAVHYAGLVLHYAADMKTVVVKRVLKNSVAEIAGIMDGDEIITIYHQPVGDYTLEQLRALLNQKGKKVEIHVKREKMIYSKTFRPQNPF
jgi:PDZ domain-containing protein